MLNKQRVYEIDRLDDVAATKLYTATGPYWPILEPQNRSNFHTKSIPSGNQTWRYITSPVRQWLTICPFRSRISQLPCLMTLEGNRYPSCHIHRLAKPSCLDKSSHGIWRLLILVLVQGAQSFPAKLQITHRIVPLHGLVEVWVKCHLDCWKSGCRKSSQTDMVNFNSKFFKHEKLRWLPWLPWLPCFIQPKTTRKMARRATFWTYSSSHNSTKLSRAASLV